MMRVEEGRGCLYMAHAAALSSFLILNKKEIWMKFNKCVVIKSKPMDGNKILVGGRNMQDIIKDKIMMGSGNNSFTNTSDVHTCPICSMDLIVAGVVIMHG
jgi:hypothetical protein